MRMPILDKNDTYEESFEKLKEETKEVGQAIDNKDKLNLAEECLDTIQVCIGLLIKLAADGIDINQSILRHCKKLSDRKWRFLGWIECKMLKK